MVTAEAVVRVREPELPSLFRLPRTKVGWEGDVKKSMGFQFRDETFSLYQLRTRILRTVLDRRGVLLTRSAIDRIISKMFLDGAIVAPLRQLAGS